MREKHQETGLLVGAGAAALALGGGIWWWMTHQHKPATPPPPTPPPPSGSGVDFNQILADIAVAQSLVEQALVGLQTAQSQINQAKATLTDQQGRLDGASKTLDTLAASVQLINTQLQQAQTDAATAQTDVQSALADAQTLIQSAPSIGASSQKLLSDLQRALTELATLEGLLASIVAELQAIEAPGGPLATLRADLDAAQKDAAAALASLKSASDTLAATQKTVSEISTSLDAIKIAVTLIQTYIAHTLPRQSALDSVASQIQSALQSGLVNDPPYLVKGWSGWEAHGHGRSWIQTVVASHISLIDVQRPPSTAWTQASNWNTKSATPVTANTTAVGASVRGVIIPWRQLVTITYSFVPQGSGVFWETKYNQAGVMIAARNGAAAVWPLVTPRTFTYSGGYSKSFQTTLDEGEYLLIAWAGGDSHAQITLDYNVAKLS